MNKTINTDEVIMAARALRLAIVQDQYNVGNLTLDEAVELVSGELTPGDSATLFNDSDQLRIKPVDALKIASAAAKE